jgi:hypothetical protein
MATRTWIRNTILGLPSVQIEFLHYGTRFAILNLHYADRPRCQWACFIPEVVGSTIPRTEFFLDRLTIITVSAAGITRKCYRRATCCGRFGLQLDA